MIDDRQIDGWMDRQIDRLGDGRQIDRQIDQIDRQIDEWMDG